MLIDLLKNQLCQENKMKSGFFMVKSFFAILLITASFSANSTVIFEISGVTAGVPFPGYHSIYKNSAELTSNYGFSLDSIKGHL